jgi:predicted nucleic acid-binding protein
MIILDTNVLSETQKHSPDGNVMAFLESLDPTSTFITAISVAEILHGIDILPDGRRKKELGDSAFKLFHSVFKNRILAFDVDAASHYALGSADARREGKAIGLADGMIAGIAKAHFGATVATRDTSPFKNMRVNVINPWEPPTKPNWEFAD